MPHSAAALQAAKPPKPPPSEPHVLTPFAVATATTGAPPCYGAASSADDVVLENKRGTELGALMRPPTRPRKAGPLPPRAPSAPSDTIAASTSFFGLPSALSSASLRGALRLPPAAVGELDWVSIAVVYWITLVSEASRGLMLPSTWPYFQSLGGSKAMLGVFVASFSMGRMATTIPLGYLSDNISTSSVLSFASLIQVVGHLFYAVAPSLPALFASRIVVGFGSATMSVCRAHLTRAVPAAMRTHHFAYLSALQFIGFAVLPGAGGLLALLPELQPFSFAPLNGFTYPAYVLILCNLISMALVYMLYFDPPPVAPRRRMPLPPPPASAANGKLQSAPPPPPPQADAEVDEVVAVPDALALVVCLLVNVVFRGVVAEFETVSTPFLMEQFDLSYGGSSFRISVIGFFGLAVYLTFKPIAKRFSDRALVLFGLSVVLLGCLPLSAPFIAPQMSLPFYVFCLGLTWSLAYPIGQTAVLALFSKVLAGLPAGGFLGIFSASGSVARVFFAMVAGTVWSHFGRESVFAMILAYVCVVAGLVAGMYRKLVPPQDVF